MCSLALSVIVTVVPVHEADHTNVAGHQEVAVTPGTETAVGVIPIIVAATTARRVALVAGATTEVARAVTTEAAPAVASVTSKMNSRNQTTAWITKSAIVKRPSLRDQATTRMTTDPNEKAVPRPRRLVVNQKMVPRLHRLLNGLAVIVAVTAAVAAVAERQMRTTRAGCSSCGVVTFAVLSLRGGHPRDRSLFYHINIATVIR